MAGASGLQRICTCFRSVFAYDVTFSLFGRVPTYLSLRFQLRLRVLIFFFSFSRVSLLSYKTVIYCQHPRPVVYL